MHAQTDYKNNFTPFFQRIFSETPCKHPVVVLKDFSNHVLSTLIDFMYGGEVKIAQEELPGLMKAAEVLQVRGLSSSERRLVSEEPRPLSSSSTLPEFMPEDARHDTPEEDDSALENTKEIKPTLFQQTRDHPTKPLIGHVNFGIRETCNSPLMPRRKQARPRRRSSELLPQDLSRRSTPPASVSPIPSSGILNLSGNQHQGQQQQQQPQLHLQQSHYSQQMINRNDQQQMINAQQNQHQQHQEDMAENLSMKKSISPSGLDHHHVKTEGSEATSSPRGSPLTGTSLLHPDSSMHDIPAAVAAAVATVIPSMSLAQTQPPEYLTNLSHLASQWLPGQSPLPPPPPQSHHPREDSPHGPGRSHPYQQQQQQESSIVSRRSSLPSMFPLDGVALGGGLFSHASTYDRTVLTDSFLADNFKPETLQNIFGAPNLGPPPTKKSKKHRNDSDGTPRRWNDHNSRSLAVNRPKGQHSAPRGGPPRSWTNNELTLALQHVWEKKLTTSQASRLFGIPYNSLLMYVRGKYGKSLKLEQLRKNCTGANTPEIMNNNNIKPVQQSAQISHAFATLSLQHPDNSGYASHRSLIGGNMTQPQGFYPAEYAASYPLGVNLAHLMPPSEQKPFESANSSGDGGCLGDGNGGGDLTNSQTSETPSPIVDHHHHQESSSSTSMQPQPTQSAPALLQQNGSD
ncbi:uncharacterized protein Lov isoform X2 [Anoplolepis gracilipes]|uniref:uncharacterized protein Lov isoform X2 n=1 Tax=Anoplolepis gracilipes TaxID=354296 RepID=UPI003BA1C21F